MYIYIYICNKCVYENIDTYLCRVLLLYFRNHQESLLQTLKAYLKISTELLEADTQALNEK